MMCFPSWRKKSVWSGASGDDPGTFLKKQEKSGGKVTAIDQREDLFDQSGKHFSS